MNNEKLISIHLNSNKPGYFEEFIQSLVKNTNNLDLVEVIVSIDKDAKRISLSYKSTLDNPWDKLKDQILSKDKHTVIFTIHLEII